MAIAAPTQTRRPMGVCSRIAAQIGVSTTYSPVMNPEMLAGVVSSPIVCTSWAMP